LPDRELQSLRQSIDRASGRGVDILGSLVQWSVPTKTTTPRDDLLGYYSKESLPIATIPPSPNYEAQLRRAVQKFNVGSKIKLKRVKKDSISHYYAAYQLAEDGTNITVNSQPKGYVELDLGGKLLFSDPTAENVWGTRLRSMMTPNLDCNDIRGSMKAVIQRCHSFPTRPTGGVYFVPEAHTESLDSLNRAVRNVSTDISIVMLPILGDDRTKADLSASFTGSMLRNIDQFKERLENFFDDGKLKQTTASLKKIEEISALRGLAVSYEAILESELGSVTKSIKDLQDYATARLTKALDGRHISEAEESKIDALSDLNSNKEEESKTPAKPTGLEIDAMIDSI